MKKFFVFAVIVSLSLVSTGVLHAAVLDDYKKLEAKRDRILKTEGLATGTVDKMCKGVTKKWKKRLCRLTKGTTKLAGKALRTVTGVERKMERLVKKDDDVRFYAYTKEKKQAEETLAKTFEELADVEEKLKLFKEPRKKTSETELGEADEERKSLISGLSLGSLIKRRKELEAFAGELEERIKTLEAELRKLEPTVQVPMMDDPLKGDEKKYKIPFFPNFVFTELDEHPRFGTPGYTIMDKSIIRVRKVPSLLDREEIDITIDLIKDERYPLSVDPEDIILPLYGKIDRKSDPELFRKIERAFWEFLEHKGMN